MIEEDEQIHNFIHKASSATDEDLFWLEIARNEIKESLKAQEEAAKQLISITTFSQTVYFAIVSFSEVKKGLALVPAQQQWLAVILLITPLLFWIFSLFSATRVFIPKSYKTNLNSPTAAEEVYKKIVLYKQRQLNRAHLALILGFIPLSLNAISYLIYFPLSPVKPE